MLKTFIANIRLLEMQRQSIPNTRSGNSKATVTKMDVRATDYTCLAVGGGLERRERDPTS